MNRFLDHDFFFNFISGIEFIFELLQIKLAYRINENLIIFGKPLGAATTKKLLAKLTNWMQDIFSFSFQLNNLLSELNKNISDGWKYNIIEIGMTHKITFSIYDVWPS